MSDLRLFLFGTPRLECDGAWVKLTRRKVTALLAYLAVTGQSHSREAVATLLWPDFDAPNAYAYLRNALWMLKQMPLADRIEAEQETLAFRQDETTWVDVTRFEAALAARRTHPHPERETCEACIPLLEEAAALYQGDFMAGFTLEDSAAFDEWQFFQAESLRRAYTGALEKLTLWYSPREPETALDYARRWQSCDPLHEGAHRHLMTLYAQLGQRAAALHLYDALIRDLRAQGLAPADETVALYQRIRAAAVPPASRPREIAQTFTQPDAARTAHLPEVAPARLPTGTVTFLFTDIQGSVSLWEQQPSAMQSAIAKHHAIVRAGIEANGGHVFKVVGDAFQSAFAFAPQAFAAALAIQRALCEADWGDLSPLCVRMGLHTGPAELTQEAGVEDYAVSHTLNRVARVMSAGSGGQILLSQETAALAQHELPPGVRLQDMGEHRLKGLAHPEHLFQAVAPGLPANFPPLTTGVLPSHNLPTLSTAFVGRRAELAEVQNLLAEPETRLITLVGPGGIGKTRLSLRAAEAALAAFPDGVFFIPLAAVETPEMIVSTMADVLKLVLYQQSAAAPFAQLTHYLHDKRMLLVLDNLEQALSGALLLADLVQQTQALKLLVTSRERLNVQGEWVLELRGLRCPETADVEEVTDYGAVRLFIERAQRANHAFAPDEAEMAAIVRICRLVEGMPLGLELAAAWTKLLSCREIADEIAVSLDFLSLALRDLPERHQSLRAVFARSWSLLSKEEQAVYCALSAFRGGFTRAAAAAVSGASLPLLASLIDKSMLYRTAPDRFDLLHVLRQYAGEQLAANPERNDAVHDRHSAYYLDWLRRLEPALKGPGKDVAFGQLAALEAIYTERENIHAAWSWAVARGKFEWLHAATFSLALFCDIRSRFREGLTLFGGVIAALDRRSVEAPPALLGLLLGIQGECLLRLSQPGAREALQRAVQVLETAPTGPELALVNVLNCYTGSWYPPEEIERRLNDSLSFYQTTNDLWGVALTLGVMGEGLSIFARRNREAARDYVQQSLDVRRQIGDLWGMAITLFTLGMIAEWGEAFVDALRFYQESLELRQTLKDLNGAANCMQSVGRVAYRLGDRVTARQMLQQSLELSREIGAPHGSPDTLEALAQIAYDESALGEACDLLRESSVIRRRIRETDRPLAFTLLRLGNICRELGESEAAREHLSESLALFEQFGPEEGRERAAAALQQVDDGAH